MFVFIFVISCSINNKLQQPEAASGVLEYAMKHFGELVSVCFLFLFLPRVIFLPSTKKGKRILGCIQTNTGTKNLASSFLSVIPNSFSFKMF